MIKITLLLLLVGIVNLSNGGPTTTEPIMVNYDDNDDTTTEPPMVNMEDDDDSDDGNDDDDDDDDGEDPIVIELPEDDEEDRAAEAAMLETSLNLKEHELYKVFNDNSATEVEVSRTEDNDEDRIIGGFFSRTGQFPVLARLFPRFGNRQFICGSTIIASRFVLTAAHCLIDGNNRLTSVPIRVGSANANSGGQVVFADRAIIHPRYIDFGGRQVSGNDIAVLRTRQTIRFNRNVRAARLATLPNVRPGTTLFTAGWGINSHTRQKGTRTTVTTCRGFPRNTPSRNSIVCVRNTSSRICSGDSGGWLGSFRSGAWISDGVTSYGPAGCPSSGNSGFTSTAYFRRWIIGVMNSN